MSPRSLFRGSRIHPPDPSSSPPFNAPTSGKNAIKTALTLLEKAVDGLPIPGLKGAAGGLVEIVKIFEKTKQNKEALQELASLLVRLEQAITTPILSRQALGLSPELEERITRLSDDLLRVSTDWQRLKTSRRLLSSVINYEDYALAIADINKRIKDSLDVFLLDTQINNTIVVENTHRAFHRVERRILNKQIQDLPHASAGYNAVSRTNAATCFKGTRESVMTAIEDWRRVGTVRLFLLDGAAGVGKSTIAQTVALLAAEDNSLLASFFFSRDENLRNRAVLFFSTIAYQFAQHNEEFAAQLTSVLERAPDAAYRTLPEQLKTMIIQPLQNMHLPAERSLLIVVDALDECDDEGGAMLLRLLVDNIHELPAVKIFITSRPESHIRAITNQSDNHEKLILHDVETKVVQGDIWRFLSHQLSVEEVRKELPDSEWSVSDQDLASLVNIAGRLFVVASTADKFIKDNIVRNPQHQLKLLLGTLSSEDGSELTPYIQLDLLYNKILEAAIPPTHSVGMILRRFQLVVGAIIILQDPLSYQSLSILLAMDITNVKAALDRLHSVIVPAINDHSPRVYHPSFTDFLTTASRCTDTRFFIEPGQHHTRLAGHCLDLMKRLLMRNICDVPVPQRYLKNKEIPTLVERVRSCVTPELAYACSYWAVHLNRATAASESLLAYLEAFAFNHLLYWIEVLSLIGRLELAYPALVKAQNFVVRHSGPERVRTLLNDGQRFVMGSYEIIKNSSLHTYYSALPFAPSGTSLFQVYKNEAKHSIQVLQGQQKHWDPSLSILTGHAGGITSVALSPNGTRLASGSWDNTVRLWDVATGVHLATLEGHSGVVKSVVFSPNGTVLASISADNSICLWSGETGAHVARLDGHSGVIGAGIFSLSGARFASASTDNTVRLWDGATGALEAVLEGHAGMVRSAAFSPNGARLASGSKDMDVCLWDGMTGGHVATLKGHSGEVTSVIFSPDGNQLATGSWDKSVRLWDGATGIHLMTLEGHSGMVMSVVFSPDGTRLASRSEDMTVRLWECTAGGACSATLSGHSWWISLVVFSPDSTRIASGSGDNTVRLWDGRTGVHIATLDQGHSGMITSVVFSPDGARLASLSTNNIVGLWDSVTGGPVAMLEGHYAEVSAVVFTLDGARIVSGSSDRTLRLWDGLTEARTVIAERSPEKVTLGSLSVDKIRLAVTSREETMGLWESVVGGDLRMVGRHSWEISTVVFSPDGTRLASGSWDRTVRLWDGTTGAHVATLVGHHGRIDYVVFSPDGSRLASASTDTTVRLWNGITGAEIATLKGHSGLILSIIFSPNGMRIASGSEDKTIFLWDGVTGEYITTLSGHTEEVNLVVFSPNGARLASGSEDGTVQLWDGLTGAHVAKLQGHSEAVDPVVFSLDGTRLVSGSKDKTMRLWDGMTGALIAIMEGHSAGIESVAFSGDGTKLASKSTDNTLLLWDAASGRSLANLGSIPDASGPLVAFASLKVEPTIQPLKAVLNSGGPATIEFVQDHQVSHPISPLCWLPCWVDFTASNSRGSFFAFGTSRGDIFLLNAAHAQLS